MQPILISDRHRLRAHRFFGAGSDLDGLVERPLVVSRNENSADCAVRHNADRPICLRQEERAWGWCLAPAAGVPPTSLDCAIMTSRLRATASPSSFSHAEDSSPLQATNITTTALRPSRAAALQIASFPSARRRDGTAVCDGMSERKDAHAFCGRLSRLKCQASKILKLFGINDTVICCRFAGPNLRVIRDTTPTNSMR